MLEGFTSFWIKERIESDSLTPHHMGKLVLVKLDSSPLVVTLSGIRIAAIASAFQAEYHRGFESHIPLHGYYWPRETLTLSTECGCQYKESHREASKVRTRPCHLMVRIGDFHPPHVGFDSHQGHQSSSLRQRIHGTLVRIQQWAR